MAETFDRPTWKARVADWWREAAGDLEGAMRRLGVRTAYGLLTGSAWLPLLTAYAGDPGPAVAALADVLGGVGTNLLSNLVQGAYDEAPAGRRAEQELAGQPELRVEYERVLAELGALAAAQGALGERWAEFEARLRGELARMGGRLQVETGGGALVFGSVVVEHGDFVGRDKHYHYHAAPEQPDRVLADDLLVPYCRALADECSRLPLGVVDPQFVRPAHEGKVSLPEVYVDLDVVSTRLEEGQGGLADVRAWGLRLARGEGEGRTPLLETLALPTFRRAVLLGDAGSGKSTFVSYVAYLLAGAMAGGEDLDLPEALRGLLPVRLVLRSAAAHIPTDAICGTAEMLWNALRGDLVVRLGEDAAGLLFPVLQHHLWQEGGLLMLDGLDEVPEAGKRRRCLLEAVRALASSLPPEARIVLTARPYAYADPEWRLPDFPVLTLAAFSEQQVERFVARWYQAVQPAMGWDAGMAQERGNRLTVALREKDYLGDLASRPLLLTLMATLDSSWGQLPEDRADLYEETVKLLLSRWQRGHEKTGPDGRPLWEPGIERALGIGEDVIRAALERLAFETQVRQGAEAEREEAPADVPQGQVLAAFDPLLPDDFRAGKLLEYLETRAGLLMGRREGVYAFPHRSFQEYLAACHLANAEPEFAERLRELVWKDLTWWREVFLLGVGKKRQGGLGDAVNVVNVLVPVGPAEAQATEPITEMHWRAAILGGQALLELRLPEKGGKRPHFEATLRRVRRWLAALLEEGRLEPRERAEAGDVLGGLGDPRPGVGVDPGTGLPDVAWVEVPAGPFLMGSIEADEQADDDERPQHTLDLPAFLISRYPITNGQYRPFVEGGGYGERRYWTEEGWAWRTGEREPDLSPIDDEDLRENYARWLAGRPVERRDRPFWWGDPHFGLPSRPVVGVSWFEAQAYCTWLTGRFQVSGFKFQVWRDGQLETLNLKPETLAVRLPSEAEWEKAARGTDGRRYPWGDEWSAGRANTEESGIGETSAAGMFPTGASPYGALDMAGNVWEWTRTRWGRTSARRPDYGYPYDLSDGREDPSGPDLRVVRGGSWFDDQRDARCACRHRLTPDGWNYILGVRVVVSLALPSSES